ncbi:hypothetical protein ES319_D04G046400v1 [Gossypium barbadense]|uniref:Uncharacterized protein n=1 Tax=Gossypium barbadense TaxID=3634 RepID=A0A5J5RRZ5_GOSBA|nr:hypothetical protein ES319_D04G046400v1 [Gossypium barbadense]
MVPTLIWHTSFVVGQFQKIWFLSSFGPRHLGILASSDLDILINCPRQGSLQNFLCGIHTFKDHR